MLHLRGIRPRFEASSHGCRYVRCASASRFRQVDSVGKAKIPVGLFSLFTITVHLSRTCIISFNKCDYVLIELHQYQCAPSEYQKDVRADRTLEGGKHHADEEVTTPVEHTTQ